MLKSSFPALLGSVVTFLFCSAVSRTREDWLEEAGLVLVESKMAVARGSIIRKMLSACLGTFRALSSALRLARNKCLGVF